MLLLSLVSYLIFFTLALIKTRQEREGQNRTRQDETRDKIRHEPTRHNTTRQDKTRLRGGRRIEKTVRLGLGQGLG
jgi:hypothetical protein